MFGNSSEWTIKPSWENADVFPLIARVIEQAYRERRGFITASEIAARLLKDAVGFKLVETAHDQREKRQSLE